MARRDELTAAIREKLVAGEFPPAQSIPEEALAAEYGVSRTPIRESLMLLQSEGLVQSETYRGFRAASIDIDGIRAYFEAARVLLVPCFGIAARSATPAQVAALRSFLETDPATEGVSGIREEALRHYRFVAAAGEATGNTFLYRAVVAGEGYHCFVRAKVLSTLTAQNLQHAIEDVRMHHTNIADCLTGQDSEELREAVENMIEGARIFLISHFI